LLQKGGRKMVLKNALKSVIAATAVVSTLSFPSGEVLANAGVEDYEVDDVLVYNTNYGPSLQETSIGNGLLNGEISPMYVPIPYNYIHTRFYTNYQVGQMVNQIPAGISSAGAFLLGLASIPAGVARPLALGGFIVATGTQTQKSYFRSAYDQGYGLQLIVRKNPNYNGYNAATLGEWVKTNVRMQ
jgi:hypothetical protein